LKHLERKVLKHYERKKKRLSTNGTKHWWLFRRIEAPSMSFSSCKQIINNYWIRFSQDMKNYQALTLLSTNFGLEKSSYHSIIVV
jgi:hypothetical protein